MVTLPPLMPAPVKASVNGLGTVKVYAGAAALKVKPIHGPLLKQRFFSVTTTNLRSAYHSTLPGPVLPGSARKKKM